MWSRRWVRRTMSWKIPLKRCSQQLYYKFVMKVLQVNIRYSK